MPFGALGGFLNNNARVILTLYYPGVIIAGMKTDYLNCYTAFEGTDLLFRGNLKEVVLSTKTYLGHRQNTSVLIFCDVTGKTMDFNFHGSKQDVLRRLEKYTLAEEPKEPTGPGRPKLGVISREISLLPRHWEWLATQAGGASATIRLLVEDARKKSSDISSVKQMQERVYQIMFVLAGDFQGYEEALRALYKRDSNAFFRNVKSWPKDIQKYLSEVAIPVFEDK